MANQAKQPNTSKPEAKAETATPEAEQPKVSKSVVPKKYRDRYKANKGRCGDNLSSELSDFLFEDGETFSQKRFEQVCRDNSVEKRWEGRNTGMKRMNLSNVLRAKIRNGVDVKIGKTTIKGAKQPATAA